MQKNSAFNLKNALFAASLTLATSPVFAQAGGMAKATSAAKQIQTGLYSLVGIIAIIYLIWMGVLAFSEKKSWADFAWAVLYVSVVGGSVAIATWAWGLFT